MPRIINENGEEETEQLLSDNTNTTRNNFSSFCEDHEFAIWCCITGPIQLLIGCFDIIMCSYILFIALLYAILIAAIVAMIAILATYDLLIEPTIILGEALIIAGITIGRDIFNYLSSNALTNKALENSRKLLAPTDAIQTDSSSLPQLISATFLLQLAQSIVITSTMVSMLRLAGILTKPSNKTSESQNNAAYKAFVSIIALMFVLLGSKEETALNMGINAFVSLCTALLVNLGLDKFENNTNTPTKTKIERLIQI